MYQWTHKEFSTSVPGKIEAGAVWPHSSSRLNVSPSKRDGESKIPKPTFAASTPKPPRPSSLSTPENSILLNGTEGDQKKIAELKLKVNKCDTMQEMLLVMRAILSEYAMQSSESSTNSNTAMTSSLINGSDSVIFDKQNQQKLISILQSQKNADVIPKTPLSSSRTIRTPPKSRTTPSTPTRNTDLRGRIRRNLSSDSVSSSPVKSDTNSAGCKRCMLMAATKTTKQLVDKATIMDVEPIEFPKAPTMIDAEIQTEVIEEKTEEISTIPQAPVPPPMPPPMPMNSAPLPPPMPPPMMMANSNCPKPPPGNDKLIYLRHILDIHTTCVNFRAPSYAKYERTTAAASFGHAKFQFIEQRSLSFANPACDSQRRTR